MLVLVLAAGLLAGGAWLGGAGLPASEQDALRRILLAGGAALLVVAGVVCALRRPLDALLASGPGEASATIDPPHVRPRTTLFLASFVALFLELALIRYCGSQIRIFAFYKNVPLMGCFLGLGLGCSLGRGRPRHVLSFLLWLVPVAAFLGLGSAVIEDLLSKLTAAASSEHVLGDTVLTRGNEVFELASQVLMGMFCVLTLVTITLLFRLLGRILGEAFEHVPRLPAYTLNILGSLAGILAFIGLSFVHTPPWTWLLVGLLPLLWWTTTRRERVAAATLTALAVCAVVPSYGDTVWSPYQKLVGYELPSDVPAEPRDGAGRPTYLVQISGVFYQVAVDLSPEAVARSGRNPYPHYDRAWSGLPAPERVLVVGAGTGNDVAAALRAGARHVDAVDIDPAIVALGRAHHPERPYDDPRVSVIVDDARSAFRGLPAGSYDAVVFGLLDSHTQLGISSVRLDNYVFTLQSFASARRLLRGGGHLIVTAAIFRDWFGERLGAMVERSGDGPVERFVDGHWTTWRTAVDGPAAAAPTTAAAGVDLPTDDWPFLYLPARAIPGAYLVMVAMLALASVIVLRRGGLDRGALGGEHVHFFFLGAGFLLMEVYAINRLALLFGTTWVVSAVAIVAVLALIVAANACVAMVRQIPPALAYSGLLLSLAGSWLVDPDRVLGLGLAASLGCTLVVLLPVFFSGIVFARSFRSTAAAGPAMGANMLGAVLGGWAEYATMAIGIRQLLVLALGFYVASAVPLFRLARRSGAPRPSAAT
jgi:SAM-dependent methyltransferase